MPKQALPESVRRSLGLKDKRSGSKVRSGEERSGKELRTGPRSEATIFPCNASFCDSSPSLPIYNISTPNDATDKSSLAARFARRAADFRRPFLTPSTHPPIRLFSLTAAIC